MTQAALALAAIFALLLAWRAPSAQQRRIAGALCLLLALDVLRGASLCFRVSPPYEGVARASWAVSGAALFAWYAVVVWTVWSVLRKDESPGLPPGAVTPARSLLDGGAHLDRHGGSLVSPIVTPTPKPATPSGHGRSGIMITALAFLASSAALFAVYPLIRGAPYMAAARAAFALALAAQALAVLRFAFRGRRPDSPQFVALLLALSSLASAAGPWAFGEPARDWSLARLISVVTWIVVGGVETWTLLRRRIGS